MKQVVVVRDFLIIPRMHNQLQYFIFIVKFKIVGRLALFTSVIISYNKRLYQFISLLHVKIDTLVYLHRMAV